MHMNQPCNAYVTSIHVLTHLIEFSDVLEVDLSFLDQTAIR